jgi:hypothetical protein
MVAIKSPVKEVGCGGCVCVCVCVFKKEMVRQPVGQCRRKAKSSHVRTMIHSAHMEKNNRTESKDAIRKEECSSSLRSFASVVAAAKICRCWVHEPQQQHKRNHAQAPPAIAPPPLPLPLPTMATAMLLPLSFSLCLLNYRVP